MGYTHYLRRKPELPRARFAAAVADCRRVVADVIAGGVPLAEDADGEAAGRPPVLTADLIRFNGVGGGGHETFYVARVADPTGLTAGKYFSFCKTARKPYDLAVCGCLIVLQRHLGRHVELGSDGTNEDGAHDENWPAAAALCQTLLGYGRDFDFEGVYGFDRFRRDGLPREREREPSSFTRHGWRLGNGWWVARGPAEPRQFGGYHWETRRQEYRVYPGPYGSDRTPDKVLARGGTLADAVHAATVRFLRDRFGGTPERDGLVDTYAQLRDWVAVAALADKIGEGGDDRLARRLTALLPITRRAAVPA